MALIDRDALCKKCEQEYGKCNNVDKGKCLVAKAETVNAKPVVHGKWTGWQRRAFHGIDDYGEPIYRDCITYEHKACGFGSIIRHNFCPRCGSDMRQT